MPDGSSFFSILKNVINTRSSHSSLVTKSHNLLYYKIKLKYKWSYYTCQTLGHVGVWMDPLVLENISRMKWQIATSVLILHFINMMHPMKIQSCHIRSGGAPPPDGFLVIAPKPFVIES